jgi:hypothetical protein
MKSGLSSLEIHLTGSQRSHKTVEQNGGSRLPPLINLIQPGSSAALLTATTFLGATAALFLTFTLLALAFLSLAFFLLSPALLAGSIRFAWFVWILLCFHITFRYYVTRF